MKRKRRQSPVHHTRLTSAARATARLGNALKKLKTADAKKEFQQIAADASAKSREALWRRWLTMPAWRVTDAAHLILGRDPADPYSANERNAGEGPQLHGMAIQRLIALAERNRIAKVGGGGNPTLCRYTPTQLIELAGIHGFPYAGDLASIHHQMQSGPKLPLTSVMVPGPPTSRKPARAESKESIPHLRAKLVHKYACAILGIGSTTNNAPIYLELREDEFNSGFRNKYRISDRRLANCGPKAMEAARTARTLWPDLPKVYLKVGRPIAMEPMKKALRRR